MMLHGRSGQGTGRETDSVVVACGASAPASHRKVVPRIAFNYSILVVCSTVSRLRSRDKPKYHTSFTVLAARACLLILRK